MVPLFPATRGECQSMLVDMLLQAIRVIGQCKMIQSGEYISSLEAIQSKNTTQLYHVNVKLEDADIAAWHFEMFIRSKSETDS